MKGPQFTIQIKASQTSRSNWPGPGAYEPKPMKRGYSATMGSSERIDKVDNYPGPQSYYPPASIDFRMTSTMLV
jgi:hypothetical protein